MDKNKADKWEHRMVRQGDAVWIAEVFYDSKGIPMGCSDANATMRDGEEPGIILGLKEQIDQMGNALLLPELNLDTDFIGEIPIEDGEE